MGVVQKLVSQNANKDAERQERSTTANGKGRLILAYKIKHAFDIQLRKSSLMSKHHIQEGSYLVNKYSPKLSKKPETTKPEKLSQPRGA